MARHGEVYEEQKVDRDGNPQTILRGEVWIGADLYKLSLYPNKPTLTDPAGYRVYINKIEPF